jgi:threonine/homoserine/homoserine lactone efflux protein
MPPFIDGIVAGYGIAIPVGAVAILIVSVSMQAGFRAGFMAGAGAATADFLYAILAGATGALVIDFLQPASQALRILSGLVLIFLGAAGIWRGLRLSEEDRDSKRRASALGTYAQFLGITLINPLTVVYFAALILGRDPSTRFGLTGLALYSLGAGLASLSWQTLLAGLGGIARNRLSPRFRLWATVLGNALVMILGLRILIAALG